MSGSLPGVESLARFCKYRTKKRLRHKKEKVMAPQPKRKISKGRRDRRRAHHALAARNLVSCSNCGSMRLPHNVCPNCGHYQGREVIEIDKEKAE
jgi:large subunit ribosomal protein L32